ncbi:MAG: electron transport complex subunit RsxB [Betaproteobacteria bacterium]|nr:electron transport complex subunit RsxB [Betaproteobacteria bacterium]
MVAPHTSPAALAAAIDAVLPQTQCRQCGYPGCRPYAEAIAAGRAAINRCPPGGEQGVRELAALLGVPAVPLDPRFGAPKPEAVAVIDEELCIGCTLCIQACPVDAIVGARKLMHTVIARECTGCELCLPPCPVDCIRMVATGDTPTREEKKRAAERARARYELRQSRVAPEHAGRGAEPLRATASQDAAHRKKQALVQRAIERARARLKARAQGDS